MPDSLPAGRVSARLERALQHLLDEAPIHVWLTDADGRTIWASRSWLAFAGRDRVDDLEASWGQSVTPDDRDRLLPMFKDAFARRVPVEVEYRIRRADGEWRRVATRGVPYEDEGGEYGGHIGVTHDLTDLRANEERASALAEQQRAILDHLRVAVFTVDVDGRYRFVNRMWEEFYNHRREEVVGRFATEFFPPEVANTMLETNRRVVLQHDEHVEYEITLDSADGPRPFLIHKLVILDADGVTPLVCGVATDLSLVRRAEEERRQLEQRLQQALRLESLGVLAGGVAHDFNNLLLGVMGNAELALQQLPADSPARGALLNITDASRRAAKLASQMLDYAGRTPAAVKRADLSELVENMQALLASSLPRDAMLELVAGGGLPPVDIDPEQMRHVVLNLVTNAAEALGGAPGSIRVMTGLARLSREALAACVLGDGCAEGEYVRLAVQDTGRGMDEATRRRVFDPFFSTKFTGRGLGLSVVHGIVRGHHGALRVESMEGSGTTVSVYLPVPGASGAGAPARAAEAPSGARKLLVVEDESAVRDVVCAALRSAGYEVEGAKDGAEGLAAWEARRDTIGLVIADLTMPRMNGERLLREIRSHGSRVPFVLMSGYDPTHETRTRTHDDVTAFLYKPFTMASLLATVRNVVGEP